MEIQEYERKITDFQALLHRFPYLKDILCKLNSDKMHNFVKEKHQTTYDADYKSKRTSNSNKITIEKKDNNNRELIKKDKRIILKKHEVSRCKVKYAGILPPEPFVVPISEYRSTIHTLGTIIIKDKLLNPKLKNKI